MKKADNILFPFALGLWDKNVEVFAVGIGNRVSRKELLIMGKTPHHVYTTPFEGLDGILRKLKNHICRGMKSIFF